jgi:hypothetical protein
VSELIRHPRVESPVTTAMTLGEGDVPMTRTLSNTSEACILCGTIVKSQTGFIYDCPCTQQDKRLYRIEIKLGWVIIKLGITPTNKPN